MPAAWYTRAQRLRAHYANAFFRVFDHVDVLLAPATPCSAPEVGQKTMTLGGETVGVRAHLGYFTQPISCVGLPVAAVPLAGLDRPFGVQVIAAPWREDLCLRVASALEAAGIAAAPVAPAFHEEAQ